MSQFYFSARMAIAQKFREWAKGNNADARDPFNVITWLSTIGGLNSPVLSALIGEKKEGEESPHG